MNEVAFKTSTTNNTEQCPGCREMLAYNKKDYFLTDRQDDWGVKFWQMDDYEMKILMQSSSSSIDKI
jgi:hypothetical protein